MRGWQSPEGTHYNTSEGEDHGDHADRLLDKFYPDWRWEEDKRFEHQGAVFASAALEYKGWLRIVCDGVYSLYVMKRPALDNLIEQVQELHPSQRVIVDVESGRGFTGAAFEFLLEGVN